ncbi:sperm-associated antigen 17 [Halictus rubicundus]|uniref:sperm-associated antigen 17 n=1 Tax=Halictus rubicundus TaxID=77578 RepID=UPI0040361BA1
MKKRKGVPKTQASGKETKPADENSWRAELEAITINDDNWWCIVTMMVETTTEHSRCVSLFNTAAEEGKRKAIYSLSCRQMLASVKMLSKPSPDKCPTIQGVCHYASKLLSDENVVIPAWLVAQIIKLLIYRIKEETIGIVKRMADLEQEIDEEYRIMQTVADWGQPGTKSFNAEKLNNKAITRLRKRGEEWRDMVYVDDAPLNGPNLYIILSGFHDPDLPEYLINAGVPLSFIMRIKRSNRDLVRLAEYRTIQEFEKTRNMYRFSVYNSSIFDLFRFWSTIETRMMDPEAHPALLDVAILLFRPPELPEIFHDDEYEHLKKDLYDQVSYFMYDLYDLYRQHRNYLKSMRIETAVVDDAERKCATETYKALLDAVPQECISLPLILFAILAQIDANDRGNLIEGAIIGTDAPNGQQVKTDTQEELKATKDHGTIVEETLRTLNSKYNLDQTDSNSGEKEPITHIELVLREDALTEITRFFDDCTNSLVLDPTDFVENILRIFWHPKIMDFHKEHKITKKNRDEYVRHIDKIRRHLDIIASSEEVVHCLHVLMFDKMIFESSRDLIRPVDSSLEEDKTTSFLSINQPPSLTRRSKSVPNFTFKDERIQFYSDGNIEYGKSLPFLVDCAPLFMIIDPRELLVPGYLEENVFSLKYKYTDGLNELNDVELLPKSVFLQRVQRCLSKYDSYSIVYFEPTDSVLLHFHDEWKADGVHEEERMCSIRTPVRLRDFCEHVVPEEQDWIRREEEMYRLLTSESLKRLMKRATELSDEKLLFTDEDFILPWSLKAEDLAKRKADPDLLSAIDETSEESEMERGGKKKSVKKKKLKDTKSNVDDASSRISKKSRSYHTIQEEASYEFIGYDLGRLRVHVRNRKTVFLSADGARVKVEMDDWLYKNKDVRITVTIQDYSLYLFHRINNPKIAEVFHLTSPLGIVLAFEKLSKLGDTESPSFTSNWSNRGFDFRGSWPSGLLIEPVIGDSEENPFYIRQSYIRNSCSSATGIREVCRKFLRNGTVLKYLDDGRVIVLRPNGDIVTCIAFEQLQDNENKKTDDEISFENGIHNEFFYLILFVPRVQLDRDSVQPMTDATVRVSRYTVVNYNGRQYEVLDDLVVSEDHRLLVRTASDYEVDEKFTRRGDGTDMLLNSNGELIVGFPDGTRIMTGYTVEKEPVMCDWTEEEIVRFFGTRGTEEDDYAEGSFSNLKFYGEASVGAPEYDDIGEILIADSFVSVLLTCRAEHKNYATVFYDQSAVSCTLSMPDDLRVSISRRGHYKVSMADGVNLKEYKVRPTNFDRTDLIRSTYAIPYDWLFPFGRNGNGIWKNTHDLPFLCENDKTVPKLLEIRVLYGFKKSGENAVINIQRALGRYWMSLVSGSCDPATPTDSADTQKDTEEIFDSLEHDLCDLSLGIKKTIDATTYRYGLSKRWEEPGARTKEPRKSIEFNELLRQKAAKREELQWYKWCFKEKFYLPYFQNITGACFLWVLECVENAPKISLANHSLGEHDRYSQIQESEEELHNTESDVASDQLMPEAMKRWMNCCDG